MCTKLHMSDDAQATTALDPSFFDGRLTIDILSWDWNLRVGIKPSASDRKASPQGLKYDRDFTIRGRIRAPRELRGRTMKVTLAPFGPKVRFGRGGLEEVGRLKVLSADAEFDFEATLMLPEEGIPATATSLASIWKRLDIWTVDECVTTAKVDAYSFAADVDPNLRAWADE